jgi:predicted small secreted protein
MKLLLVGLAAASVLVAGCNTMQGLGEDITAGGNKVEDVLKNDEKDDTSGTDATTPEAGRATDSNPAGPNSEPPETSMSRPPSPTTTQ